MMRRTRKKSRKPLLPESQISRSVDVFAAKLLFQFRVVSKNGRSSRRRLTEERIVLFRSASKRSALSAAKRLGKDGESSYTNHLGEDVLFEFIGIMDLRQLGIEQDTHEVWYEFKNRLTPMERRDEFVPADATLLSRAT